MAKKAKTVFVCQECGYESAKWMGQCICGAWNSMVEEKVVPAAESADKRRRGGTVSSSGEGKRNRPSRLTEVRSGDYTRMDTGIGELNRVLGGGMVKGSLTLISGEPGIGKSTIIIQAAANIAEKYGKVLYVSGEESEDQIKMRADRVCKTLSENLFLLAETNMEVISAVAEELKPEFIIIDSIQTMYTEDHKTAYVGTEAYNEEHDEIFKRDYDTTKLLSTQLDRLGKEYDKVSEKKNKAFG